MRLIYPGILSLMLLTSCHTDNLYYPDLSAKGVQTVRYDWSADPQASATGMRVWFYPRDWDGQPIPADFGSRDGGEVSLPAGSYDIVSYNNDTEWLMADGTEGYESHSLSTRDADLLEPLAGMGRTSTAATDTAERVAACPEPAWGASVRSMPITSGDTVILRPVPLHCTYTFAFVGIDSLELVSRASASISGMSAAVNLGTLSHRGDLCTHPLSAQVDASHHIIKGRFYTFGVPQGSTSANRMSLFLIMKDGRKIKFTQGPMLDVTSQIRSAPDPRNVDITVTGLHLPAPTDSVEGSFDIGADDWQDVNINLPI